MAYFSNIVKTSLLVVVLLACIGYSQAGHLEEFKKAHEECLTESGVEESMVHKAIKEAEFADDKTLKCYFKCILTKKGSMDADGKLVKQEYHGPHADEVNNIFDKCKDNQADDPCETAFNFSKCCRDEFTKLKAGQ